VVQGYSHPDFGGMTGTSSWIHNAGQSGAWHDDWDSFTVRLATDPTVTLYFGGSMTDPRVYGLGSYTNLNNVNNQIDGANVPCGIRIRAWGNSGFTGTAYTVTGPANVAAVPGTNDWDSMIIETTTCP
jgi:hypothetical protein